jgi:hypothetical protein
LLAELVVHGRGNEPVIVVGSTMSLVARSMVGISPEAYLSMAVVYVCHAPLGNDSSIIRPTSHGQKSPNYNRALVRSRLPWMFARRLKLCAINLNSVDLNVQL